MANKIKEGNGYVQNLITYVGNEEDEAVEGTTVRRVVIYFNTTIENSEEANARIQREVSEEIWIGDDNYSNVGFSFKRTGNTVVREEEAAKSDDLEDDNDRTDEDLVANLVLIKRKKILLEPIKKAKEDGKDTNLAKKEGSGKANPVTRWEVDLLEEKIKERTEPNPKVNHESIIYEAL